MDTSKQDKWDLELDWVRLESRELLRIKEKYGPRTKEEFEALYMLRPTCKEEPG